MDTHARAMLTFVLAWQPYGGCDEQILPEFGISPRIFYSRVQSFLDGTIAHGLDCRTAESLQEFCTDKLTGHRQTTHPTGHAD